MVRDDIINEAADMIRGNGIGCKVMDVGGKKHILCHAININGESCSPTFWITLSSSLKWMIQTYNDKCYILDEFNAKRDIINIMNCFDHCYTIADADLIKYKIRRARCIIPVESDGDVIDIHDE